MSDRSYPYFFEGGRKAHIWNSKCMVYWKGLMAWIGVRYGENVLGSVGPTDGGEGGEMPFAPQAQTEQDRLCEPSRSRGVSELSGDSTA